jgi:hypothetical protein
MTGRVTGGGYCLNTFNDFGDVAADFVRFKKMEPLLINLENFAGRRAFVVKTVPVVVFCCGKINVRFRECGIAVAQQSSDMVAVHVSKQDDVDTVFVESERFQVIEKFSTISGVNQDVVFGRLDEKNLRLKRECPVG